MNKTHSNLYIVTFLALSSALLAVSYLRSQVPDDFLSGLLLQVGSTLLLVPVVLFGERVLTNRIELLRDNLRSELRDLRSDSSKLTLADLWEDAHPFLERLQHTNNTVFILVGIPDHPLWLGFGTFRNYFAQASRLCSFVNVYYESPYRDERGARSDFLYWLEGVSLETLLENVEGHLKSEGHLEFTARLDKGHILRNLRTELGLPD